MHGYATDGNSVRQPTMSETSGNLSKTATRTLSRLRRINNVLAGGPDANRPDGPRPVPMGMLGVMGDVLGDLINIEEELYKIEQTLGIDEPPTPQATPR